MRSGIEAVVMWLAECGVIDSEDIELYEYALHSLLLMLAPLLMVIVIGIPLGMVKEGIVMIFPFMLIRKFSGGFHAKNEKNCLILSSALLFICLLSVKYIVCGIWLNAAVFVAVISLVFNSPIDCENRRLEAGEKKHYKTIAGILASIFAIVYWVGIVVHQDRWAVCIAIGLILSAGLQVPHIVVKKRKTE